MIELILNWLLSATALFLTSKIVDDFRLKSYGSALLATVVVGFLNWTVRPILLLFTLPINILTLGLFTFVVNAIVLKVAAKLMRDFDIVGWMPAIIGAVVLSLLNLVLYGIFPV
ncbi:MAG: phage holin family protein [Bacteriovoracaceae bacterium]